MPDDPITPDPVTPPVAPPVDPPATPPADPPADPALGPSGEAALKAERARAATAEKTAKALQKQLDEIADANLNDVDRLAKGEYERGVSEATKAANERILKTEVRAAATGKLTDPADALAYLDLTTLTVGDDGEVDTAAVVTAIDALLAEKPYLGSGATPPPAVPGVPTGARPGTSTPQLSRGDLKTMSPEQIVDAKASGQLNDLLGT